MCIRDRDYTFTRFLYANVQWVHGLPDEFGAGDWLSEGWVIRASGMDSDADGTTACSASRDGTQCVWETKRSRIGDYIVAGVDLRAGATLLRLFSIVDLTGAVTERWDAAAGKRVQTQHSWTDEEASSMVLYPELSYNFGNGLEMAGGVILMFGGPDSKFNEPAAGGDQAFARARYRF